MRRGLACLLVLAVGCKVDSGEAPYSPSPGVDASGVEASDHDGAVEDAAAATDASEEDRADAGPDVSAPHDGAADDGDAPETMPDVTFLYDVSPPDSKDVCASAEVEAHLPTLAVYVMLDRSGSMTFSNKWQTAIDAISQFAQDPSAVGLKVALQYFPLELGDAGESCTGVAYAAPAVDMGLLPGHAPALLASLQAQTPAGVTTPTEAALNGLSLFGHAYGNAPPGDSEKVIGLLVTDGMPAGPCDNTTSSLQAIAAASYGGTPSVPIYVMGMSGADFTVLGEIAKSGGTAGAYSVTSGGADAFLATLQEIRGTAIGCEYPMPETDAGLVNPSNVEILFTPTGATPQKLTRQAGAGTCGLGWYYDDNAAPTKILLCPSTCKLVQGDATGKVQISLGCLGS